MLSGQHARYRSSVKQEQNAEAYQVAVEMRLLVLAARKDASARLENRATNAMILAKGQTMRGQPVRPAVLVRSRARLETDVFPVRV